MNKNQKGKKVKRHRCKIDHRKYNDGINRYSIFNSANRHKQSDKYVLNILGSTNDRM